MKEFAEERYGRLRRELEVLEDGGTADSQWIPEALCLIRMAMDDMKAHLNEHPFGSAEEEIQFFKQTKPAFQRWHIYYAERMAIAAGRPSKGKKKLAKYYYRLADYYHRYCLMQAFFYQYFKRGGSELDSHYFIRGHRNEPAPLPEMPEADADFSTAGSYLYARFMAIEQLQDYLSGSISAFTGKYPGKEDGQKPPVTWTASKAQFIELAYALQSTGVFNNGAVDVKQVFEYLTQCFNITVTNYYGYFQTMRIRKKDRTPFLRMLMEYTVRRMDESDEFPRYS